jgi:hypothetical protein
MLKNVSMSMLAQSPEAALLTLKFLRECLFVAHPQMAPMLLMEGDAEEDGAVLPAATAVSLGSILQNSISAENFSDKFSSSNL